MRRRPAARAGAGDAAHADHDNDDDVRARAVKILRKVRGKDLYHEVGEVVWTDIKSMPAPPRPAGVSMTKCIFCLEEFHKLEACSNHMKCCLKMDYAMWLSRTRMVNREVAGADCPCPHCGTRFTTPRGRGRHSTGCATRRSLFMLPLNTGAYHPTVADAAQIVVRQHRGWGSRAQKRPASDL